MSEKHIELLKSYDRLAEKYAARFNGELNYKPLDCDLLSRFSAGVIKKGRVCDLGCGPGHITRFLKGCGINAFGIDLSPEMLVQAKRLNPMIEFRQGDMYNLYLSSDSLSGIVAFYSIIHTPRHSLEDVFCEMRRVLEPGGLLLLSFHLGDEDLHLDELWGTHINVDFCFFTQTEIESRLLSAGFLIDETIERDPYPGVEFPSRRAYCLAHKPSRY